MGREKGTESLRDAVRRLDKGLWHQLEEVWRLAGGGIQDAQKSKDGHQQGTHHSLSVQENLAALIPDEWKGTRFSATDLFCLSAAAALHDTGKAGDSPDDQGHVSVWERRNHQPTQRKLYERAKIGPSGGTSRNGAIVAIDQLR